MSDSFFRRNSADQDKKIDAELLLLGGLEVLRQRVTIGDKTPNALILDDNGAGMMYVGTAAPGTPTNVNAWRIKQILTSGNSLRILWAEGDSDFTHVWDSRASLSYV